MVDKLTIKKVMKIVRVARRAIVSIFPINTNPIIMSRISIKDATGV
jgi:hypothetical protein